MTRLSLKWLLGGVPSLVASLLADTWPNSPVRARSLVLGPPLHVCFKGAVNVAPLAVLERKLGAQNVRCIRVFL